MVYTAGKAYQELPPVASKPLAQDEEYAKQACDKDGPPTTEQVVYGIGGP